jgi:tRNA(Ile)-lysidine synthetase-like protein
MNLLEKVRRYAERHRMLSNARGVLVAVSGGPDSVALLDILVRLVMGKEVSNADARIHVAHLDHMLRGRESAADAEFVRALAEGLGLSVTIGSADVKLAATNSGRGIEEVARQLRYKFLLDTAQAVGCDRIAVGHTMNDQAETFIMRLVRGSGMRGLTGMRPVVPAHLFDTEAQASCGEDNALPHSVLIIRPLLCITRDEVESYCRERKLQFRIDSTNLTTDHARNRVRHQVLPVLTQINPGAIQHIARAAEIIAADQDALDELARSVLDRAQVSTFDEVGAVYSVGTILQQPIGLRRRLIREAIRRAGAPIDQIGFAHVIAAERLLEEGMSGKHIVLSGGVVVWREFDSIAFQKAVQVATYCVEISSERPRVEAGGFEFALLRNLPGNYLRPAIEQARREREQVGRDWMVVVLDDAKLPDKLIIRPRRSGERARVLGQAKTKKLKNLMIDHKIPVSRRATWPVVATADSRYIWSPGLPPSVEFAACDERHALAILRALGTKSK